MLCKDCPHCRTKRVGYVSTRSFCMLSKGSEAKGTKLGVFPWKKTPHPKCPLNNKPIINHNLGGIKHD